MAEGYDADQIDGCLGDILGPISMHFALEERLMKTSGYEHYEAHKSDHEDLLDQGRDLMDEFNANPAAGSILLEQRLSDWFVEHFSTRDALLHGSLKH